MATISTFYPYNPVRPSSSFSSLFSNLGKCLLTSKPTPGRGRRKLVVFAAHSNPKILKTNRKSRFGQALSPYDSDADDEAMEDEDEDDDDGVVLDDWLSDVFISPSSCNYFFSATVNGYLLFWEQFVSFWVMGLFCLTMFGNSSFDLIPALAESPLYLT